MQKKGPRETAVTIFIACSVSRPEQISRLMTLVVIPFYIHFLSSKGKARQLTRYPVQTVRKQMELKADFIPSFVFLASPSLPRCDSSAWVGLSMSLKSQGNWLAEELDSGTWLFIAGSRQVNEHGHLRFFSVTMSEELSCSPLGHLEPKSLKRNLEILNQPVNRDVPYLPC